MPFRVLPQGNPLFTIASDKEGIQRRSISEPRGIIVRPKHKGHPAGGLVHAFQIRIPGTTNFIRGSPKSLGLLFYFCVALCVTFSLIRADLPERSRR